MFIDLDCPNCGKIRVESEKTTLLKGSGGIIISFSFKCKGCKNLLTYLGDVNLLEIMRRTGAKISDKTFFVEIYESIRNNPDAKLFTEEEIQNFVETLENIIDLDSLVSSYKKEFLWIVKEVKKKKQRQSPIE